MFDGRYKTILGAVAIKRDRVEAQITALRCNQKSELHKPL